MTFIGHSDTNYSSVLSELMSTGGKFSASAETTRYVCHTSTIPLATTVDTQALLEDWTDSCEVTHSLVFQPGFDPVFDYRCCKKHCMFVGRTTSQPERLRTNCPCSQIVREDHLEDGEEVDIYLQPLCFLQVLKELRYRFGYLDSSACESDEDCCHNDGTRAVGVNSNRPKLDLKEVMFCQNADAITDESYSAPLRSAVGFSGWSRASSVEKIAAILSQLYWFRKYVSDSTRVFLRKKYEELGLIKFKSSLEQCLHTLNGAIIKKLLLFPCEMEGYRKLAQLTAALFSGLIRDYLRTPHESDVPSEVNSLFTQMKTDMQTVKSRFCSEHREFRLGVLGIFQDRGDVWARFWGGAFNRLRKRVEGLDQDYTMSPAFVYTMSGFSQTRNLGHLPRWVAEFKRRAFRESVGRPREEIPLGDVKLIMKMVIRQANRAGIERRFLSVTNAPTTPDYQEVISSLDIPLKPTASVNSTVSAGGKVEDARQLLDSAISNGWEIPTRDFTNGAETGTIRFTESMRKERAQPQGYIFWISLQLVINSVNEREPTMFKEWVKPLAGQEPWLKTMFHMKIVHISEPGKERNLTKTSSPLAWVLTVSSKVSQMVLSYNQDHRAGLVLSAQDWMHQRRVSAESFESEWLYDYKTRVRKNAFNCFQDWTESTDFIPRRVGLAALRAWFAYIAFPDWFGRLVRWLTQQDYTVSEVIGSEWGTDGFSPVYYSGLVREGFMMSMPLTKTVLHLMHDVNIGLVESIFQKHGVGVSYRPTQFRQDPERDHLGPFFLRPEDF